MRFRSASTAAAAALALSGCAADPAVPASPRGSQPAVVLDEHVPGQETSAWLTSNALCIRTTRTDGPENGGEEDEATFCEPAPEELTRPGPPLLPAKPLPHLWPLDPEQRDIILIGTARGAIADVAVTMFGRTVTAPVHRLPAPADVHAGAYAVWLPRSEPGRRDMNLDDITAVTARDATGRIVAEIN